MLHAAPSVTAGAAVLDALDRLSTGAVLDVSSLSKTSVTRAIKTLHTPHGGVHGHPKTEKTPSQKTPHGSKQVAEFPLADGRVATVFTSAAKPKKMTVVVGPAGPAGPRGATGPQGPAGPQGLTGPQGPAGVDGTAGATGPAGPTGATGPQGVAGATGPAGTQGPAGATGPAGPQGPAGTGGIVASYDGVDDNTQVVPADGAAHFVSGPKGALVTLTLTAGEKIYVSAEAALGIVFSATDVTSDNVDFGIGIERVSPQAGGAVAYADGNVYTKFLSFSAADDESEATAVFTPGAGTWTIGFAASVLSGSTRPLAGGVHSHISVLVLN